MPTARRSVFIAFLATGLLAQDAGWVATIKPARSVGNEGLMISSGGHRLDSIDSPIADVMTFCYDVHRRQILDGPAWLRTDRFDISARLDGDNRRNRTEWQETVREILTDRFKLVFHREIRVLPVYAFTAGKTEPKLNEKGDPDKSSTFGFPGLGNLVINNGSLAYFATVMQRYVLDRPVIDRTGITGVYSFTMHWRPDEFQFANFISGAPLPPKDDDDRPALSAAVQQQLGLRLESIKAPVEVLVIDHIEKPSEN
ncbi:MAG TPA: TIGR03435 family protein [Bryobacteraceae bacterium]|jgi:uncharacterized protein (TIGR03435 family)|nr:TIGR03435 family protein [Bryobacteraceae bacterium]